MKPAEKSAAAVEAAGSDAVEVFALDRRVHVRRWRGDTPAADLRREERGLAVRVRRHGRVGLAAASGRLDPALHVAAARTAALSGPTLPARFAGKAISVDGSGPEHAPAETIADSTVTELARQLRGRHPDARITIDVVETDEERLVRSSEGALAHDNRRFTILRVVASRAAAGEVLDVVYEAPWRPGAAGGDRVLDWLDVRLRWTGRQVALPHHDLPVVLAPRALDALVVTPLAAALSGPALLNGTSFLLGPPREAPGDRGLTLLDDPTWPGAPRSRRFDDEGVPTARRDLLRHGAVAGYALDLSAAERLNLVTTGNARRRWDTWPAAEPSTLVVPAGSIALTQLLATWPRVVLVDQVSGEWFTDAGDAGVSASANVAFLVEGGEIVGRVRGLALGAARDDLLHGTVIASRETEWAGDRAVLPYAHAAGLTVGDAGE